MVALLAACATTMAAQQAPVTIEMITWDVAGLDSNNVTAGNNIYLVGARVCNTSGSDLSDVEVAMVWDSTNLLIDFSNSPTPGLLTEPVLAANSCFDFYFNVSVERTALSYDATRDYHIEVTADSFPTAVTNASENRQIYVERLIAQNRNKNLAITGPATAYVGGIFEFTMQAETATPYEQIQSFIVFPSNLFQVISSTTSYSQVKDGAAGTVDGVYNDACAWVVDQTSPDYNSCSGSGKAGGTLTQTYFVKILDYPTDGSSSITLNGVIYDFSGASFHYNSNYNDSTGGFSFEVTPTPTAVNYQAGTAVHAGSQVELNWRTSMEVGNLGFHVWRDLDGKRDRITPSLIAGSAFMAGAETPLTAGMDYVWVDDVSPSDHPVYWIEAFGVSGDPQMLGPIYPTRNELDRPARRRPATLVDQLSPSKSSDRGFRRLGAVSERVSLSAAATVGSAAGDQRNQFELAASKAVKVRVDRAGWYRVDGDALAAAGLLSERSHKLRLFVDGLEASLMIDDGGDGRIDAADAVYFYGTGADTPYTDQRTFWITADSKPGSRVTVGKTGRVTPLRSTSFPYTVERKDRVQWIASLANGLDDESWFGPAVASVWGMNVTQSMTVSNLDPSGATARLEVALQGTQDRLGDQYDHRVTVSVNGTVVGELVFDGLQKGVGSFAVPPSYLSDGENEVKLVSQKKTWDVSVVDYVRLTYPHLWKAEADQLHFIAPGSSSVAVSGFTSSDVIAIDVTDPLVPVSLPVSVAPDGSGWTASISTLAGSERVVHALTRNAADSPAQVVSNDPSDWNDRRNAADLVIIGHGSFLDEAIPLAEARRDDGYRVELIDVEDIYDEFSAGSSHPDAIRTFLQHAVSDWASAPHYVIFFGDASVDPRDYLGGGSEDFVPTRMLMTAFSKSPSDDWFTDFDGDGAADIPIGRFPVRNQTEAAAMVAKTLSYSSAPGTDWSRRVVMVTDRNDPSGANDFVAATEEGVGMLPASLSLERIDSNAVGAASARTSLLQSWTSGAGLINYYGHGTAQAWSSSNLLTGAHARSLNNGEKLPVVSAMTCLLSWFHVPSGQYFHESLGESLMRNPRGGAVAVWGSSGLTFLDRQTEMNQEFMRLFFGDGLTIGEAVSRAKLATQSRSVRQTWILFGDPTLKFAGLQ